MNLLERYYYIYLHTHNFYLKVGQNEVAHISAYYACSLLNAVNLASLWMLINHFGYLKLDLNKLYFIILFFGIPYL